MRDGVVMLPTEEPVLVEMEGNTVADSVMSSGAIIGEIYTLYIV